jgi:hypothetical protein
MRLAVALILAAPLCAMAATAFLTDSWTKNGNNFCKYSNGTVLNMGYKVCPVSIQV